MFNLVTSPGLSGLNRFKALLPIFAAAKGLGNALAAKKESEEKAQPATGVVPGAVASAPDPIDNKGPIV